MTPETNSTPQALSPDSAKQQWKPLGERLGGPPIDRTWQEGIPPWIYNAVCQWLDVELISSRNSELLFARLHYPGKLSLGESLARTLSSSDLLDWIDGILHINAERVSRMPSIGNREAEQLETLLREGHSIWRVSDDRYRLERRQDDTVTKAAHKAAESARSAHRTSAAEHLRISWTKVYGLHPNPSEAFREAILAVEAAAVPVINPKDPSATLGHVYGQLKRQGHLYEWAIHSKETGDTASVESVTQLIGLLWFGHSDRHEGNVPVVPITQEAAEIAVHAAATLVQWFASGVIRRKPRRTRK